MSEVDFSDLNVRTAWVEERTSNERSMLASRSVLRICPFLNYADNADFNAKSLATFRATLIAAIHGSGRSIGFDPHSAASMSMNLAAESPREPDGYPPLASFYALEAMTDPSGANKADSVSSAAISKKSTGLYSYLGFPATKAFGEDCSQLHEGLILKQVWSGEPAPALVSEKHDEFLQRLTKDPRWRFFHDWYLGMWEGTWTDWDLAHEVAKIEASVWEEGLDAVAARVRDIEAKLAVSRALEEIPTDASLVGADRHGIGGNAPPERLDEVAGLHEQTTLIWAGVETVRDEVASENPNRERVQWALVQLTNGLAACSKWIGRKADLSVDTLVKWGVPTYFVAHPEKLQALIDAVLKWVTFL